MSKNLTELSKRKGIDNNLFEKVSRQARGLNDLTKTSISDEFLIGTANVLGAQSFYDLTRKENQNKKVFVCNGSACEIAGTQTKVKEKLQAKFDASEIGSLCCLGRCYENAAFQYEGRNFSGEDIAHFSPKGDPNSLPKGRDYLIYSHGAGLLTSESYCKKIPTDIVKTVLKSTPEALLDEVIQSKVRGRGGAAFPMGLKMTACKDAEGSQKYIVCNADEGDPASYSDRYLLEEKPHAVLLGMYIAGYITGADTGILYVRAEYPDALNILNQAIEEWKSSGIMEDDRFTYTFKIIEAQGAYICGEETALLASIEGQRPEVRIRPPFPTTYGLFGQPTLVNNVETFANLPFIVEMGGDAFGRIGTEDSSGTKLLSVDGFFNRPGVYEVEMGFSLKQLIYDIAGGFRKPVKALHIGGPLGGLVPINKIDDLLIEYGHFQKAGFSLGHASILCIPEDYPIIQYLEHLFSFTAHESCGKCFPCRLGSKRGAEMLSKAQANGYRISSTLFNDLLETLDEGSLCGLGGGLPLPVRNTLTYFSKELAPFFE